MPLILPGNVASATAGGYEVANSCRFNRGDSPGLTLTQSSPTDNNKWTFSCWFKIGALTSAEGWLFLAYSDSTNMSALRMNGSGDSHTLAFWDYQSAYTGRLVTNRSFRDPSAWYHVVCVWDSDNGTAGNRMRMYINGTEETSFSTDTNPDSGQSTIMNTSSQGLEVGRSNAESAYFDGYMAEVVFIDGTAYAASDFGEFDEDSPTIWKPKNVSGLTFGTNGFYLDFEASDNLGNDANGGTDLTEVNLDATDQATDTPTNNFATLNPLYKLANITFSEGDLVQTNSGSWQTGLSTIGVSSGKWYWECKFSATTDAEHGFIGVCKTDAGEENTIILTGNSVNSWGYENTSGYKNDSTVYATGSYASWGVGDIVGCYLDLDNLKIYWAKAGAIQNSGTGIAITAGTYVCGISSYYGTMQMNYGNPAFAITSGNTDAKGYGNFEYSPNDGGASSFDSAAKDFLALNTKNLAEFG